MNVNIPQPQLEHALRMVQQGRMGPEEAAQWLLQNFPEEPMTAPQALGGKPSVAQLMQRLGPPPLEIQKDWDVQVAVLASSFLRDYGVPIAEMTAHDLLIDGDNRLALAPRWIEHAVAAGRNPDALSASPFESLPNSRQIAQDSIASESNQATRQAFQSKKKVNRSALAAKHRSAFAAKQRWVISASIFVAAIGIIAGTLYLLTLEPAEADRAMAANEIPPRLTKPESPSIFSPSNTSTPLRQQLAHGEPADRNSPNEFLSTDSDKNIVESSLPSVAPPRPETPSRMTMGLDSFAGGDWVSASDLLPEADFDTAAMDASSPEITSDAMPMLTADTNSDASPQDVDLAATNELMEDAPDSPTNQLQNLTAVALPTFPSRATTDDELETVTLAKLVADELTLEFPSETNLSISKVEQGWAVKDGKDEATVGTFILSENELRFQWTTTAATRFIARQLATGLIRCRTENESSNAIFLRPIITAPAWPIDFTTGDTKAAWLIDVAPPQGPSSLDITFQLPKPVVQTWVQPHDPEKIRRCQSIVEFTLDSDPTISIRSRIDLRTGSRITLRMRHAAQLDKDFPWQLISTTRVQSAIVQVTDQLARAINEQSQLKTRYAKADTNEKKRLTPQRDMIDAIVARLQLLSKRLGKYDSFLTELQEASFMNLRLAVRWSQPSDTPSQTIFETTSPSQETP